MAAGGVTRLQTKCINTDYATAVHGHQAMRRAHKIDATPAIG